MCLPEQEVHPGLFPDLKMIVQVLRSGTTEQFKFSEFR